MSIQQVLYVRLTLGLYYQSQHGMHFRKIINEILSSKPWRGPKTVIFLQMKAMNKLSTGYSSLLIIPADSLQNICSHHFNFFYCR